MIIIKIVLFRQIFFLFILLVFSIDNKNSFAHKIKLESRLNNNYNNLSIINATLQSLSYVSLIMAQEKLKITFSRTTPLPLITLIYQSSLRELERLTNNFPNSDDNDCHICLVCINNNDTNNILGYIDIDKRNVIEYPKPYISDIVVDQLHRRKGIAQLLLKECEKISKNWKNNELYLLAETKNFKALLLYEKIGYLPIQFEITKNHENVLKFSFDEVFGHQNNQFNFNNKKFLNAIKRFDRILFKKIM